MIIFKVRWFLKEESLVIIDWQIKKIAVFKKRKKKDFS